MKRAAASSMMEPLRAVLGASMSLADAVERLARHNAEMAPVVLSGKVAGVLPRSTAEHAKRLGAGTHVVGEILCGGAPTAGMSAGPVVMKARMLGVAQALLVTGPGGVVAGFIPRRRITEMNGGVPRKGTDHRSRIEALMGVSSARLLRRAGALADECGVGLHLAGGVVRDLLMGIVPGDIDLVVEGDGIAFAARLASEMGGRLTRHHRFGTAVIRLDQTPGRSPSGLRIDVATARREQYEHPAALPSVEPASIHDDIERRDVTINSMMIRLNGRRFGWLVDEVRGRADLRRHALQVHHGMSLVDDPTRAFRIARFAARFGFTSTEDTRRSLTLARRLGAFERLGGERLLHELILIASEPDPSDVWRHCATSGVLSDVGPALRWERNTRHEMQRFFGGIRNGILGAARLEIDRTLVMLMLLSRGASRAQRRALATRLRMTGRAAARLERSTEDCRSLAGVLSRGPTAGRVTRVCEDAAPEILALAWSMDGPAARTIDLYLRELRLVRPSLGGGDLKEMGLPAGPGYAVVLDRLRQAILDGRIQGNEQERAMALRLVRWWRRKR